MSWPRAMTVLPSRWAWLALAWCTALTAAQVGQMWATEMARREYIDRAAVQPLPKHCQCGYPGRGCDCCDCPAIP